MQLLILIDRILMIYTLVLIGRALVSWLPNPPRSPLVMKVVLMLYQLTDPVLTPVRRWLAPYQRNSPLDFSVLLVLVAIAVVRSALRRTMTG